MSATQPSRRTVLKSAVVAGAVGVWSVPVIESFAMTHASADVVSGGPTSPPSASIDPTQIVAPPTDPSSPAGNPTGSVDPTSTTTAGGGAGPVLPASHAAAAAGGPSALASTGVTLPVGATTAVAVGTIAAGVAAVVIGNRMTPATPAVADGSAPAPGGPRRH